MMKPLREARREKALSIEALAEESGVSTKTIVQIELTRSLPKLRTIGKLSKALGVEPIEIEEFAAAIRGDSIEDLKKAAA
jgi:transcriptional regulator with XRE-family HTH domain